MKQTFVFFCKWDPRKDNTPTSKAKKVQPGRKSKSLKHLHKPGGLFFSPDSPGVIYWESLCLLFPAAVNQAKLDDVILQCGPQPLQLPTTGIRKIIRVDSPANRKAIEERFSKLPPALKQWINEIQVRIGNKYSVVGYDEDSAGGIADHLPDDYVHYKSKGGTEHIGFAADLADNSTWEAVQKLPGTLSFTACHCRLDENFPTAKFDALIANIVGLAKPKFVLLVPKHEQVVCICVCPLYVISVCSFPCLCVADGQLPLVDTDHCALARCGVQRRKLTRWRRPCGNNSTESRNVAPGLSMPQGQR